MTDIGLGGLRFLSHLRLTPQEKMIFQFTTNILGYELQLNGRIVWYRELDYNIFEYGVSFVIDELKRDELAALSNKLIIKIRKDPIFSEGDFIQENPITYLKNKAT